MIMQQLRIQVAGELASFSNAVVVAVASGFWTLALSLS